jgi:hypothetical protein
VALTLAEAAKLSQNPIERGVIETFVINSSVLDRMPLKEIAGNAYAYQTEGTLPGVEFRAVNAAYAESTGTINTASEKLVILGGDADVDSFLVKTGGQLADLRATQTAGKVKAATYKYQDAFFNGDTAVDANSFDGLKKRLTGAQVVAAGTNGIPVVGNGGSDAHAFFDALDTLLSRVPGINAQNGAIYANAAIIAKIRSAGRRLGGVDMVTEDLTSKRVLTWNGIPLLDAGQTAAGVDILGQAETQGTSNVASSVYAVKFGSDVSDMSVTGLTNGGISVRDLGEIDAKPVLRTRIEFFCGLALFGGRAAARLTGVLNG